MMMTHIFTCILFVLMCHSSNAAFTATLPTGSHYYPQNGIIRYNQVLLADPGYNSASGVFTAPMNGTYSVSVTMMSGLVTAHLTLRKNTVTYVWLYTGNEYDMATQNVNMNLVIGDQIWVQMTNRATYLFDVYNTFSAVLIP
uniref:Putative C1q domain containing protein MgC1q48 n=1 Tax=Mytilus galloprovincialis TaxID=29158 RepID=F0V485_MYTGA|nr:putative C1q domain containing protein MgC1q48 [Mytilus galloprovincialis]